MGVMRPELVMRNVVPVVMAGVLGIYGLIVGAILISKSAFIQARCGAAVMCCVVICCAHAYVCIACDACVLRARVRVCVRACVDMARIVDMTHPATR